MLFQDDCGGLEVESPREPGKFIPAPPIPGSVVFNIGDFLMRWSNGVCAMTLSNHCTNTACAPDTLKSTLHRVRAPPPKLEHGGVTRERYSIPYVRRPPRTPVGRELTFCSMQFMTADHEKVIDALPGCFGPDRPKKYEPINAGEYINMRLNATY